ncbi:helix-turn-helix domain-containing protein, partial [Streptomyces sp. NPDC056817]|uniref:helix-turn-helix domain-containing protein n=1 Tax=Streptomyces sp. NPDC056817 TaxID=3345950 RepID=UPI0036760FF6
MATTKRFDLTQPSYDLFRSKNTHGPPVQQSFAFDWVNKFMFVATKRSGSAESAGDLCINKMDFGGNYISYMHLDGFGHGVAFAALPSGSGTELWIECATHRRNDVLPRLQSSSAFMRPTVGRIVVVQLRYNYRTNPDASQCRALARAFGYARVVWNDCLRDRKEEHAAELPYVKSADLSRLRITQAKRTEERAWLADVSAVVLQQSL